MVVPGQGRDPLGDYYLVILASTTGRVRDGSRKGVSHRGSFKPTVKDRHLLETVCRVTPFLVVPETGLSGERPSGVGHDRRRRVILETWKRDWKGRKKKYLLDRRF